MVKLDMMSSSPPALKMSIKVAGGSGPPCRWMLMVFVTRGLYRSGGAKGTNRLSTLVRRAGSVVVLEQRMAVQTGRNSIMENSFHLLHPSEEQPQKQTHATLLLPWSGRRSFLIFGTIVSTKYRLFVVIFQGQSARIDSKKQKGNNKKAGCQMQFDSAMNNRKCAETPKQERWKCLWFI